MISSFVQSLYDPTFIKEAPTLAEFVDPDNNQEAVEAVNQKVEATALGKVLTSDEIPKPLNYEEAVEIQNRIQEVKKDITATRTRISKITERIDTLIDAASANTEVAFKIDIDKRSQLKRAIKKAFGVKTDTITYSMYKAALQAKRELEAADSKEYLQDI